MTMAKSLELKDAESIARALVERLAAHCERIEVAGSIRRRREQVNDIDLVAIPRFTSKWSMFAPGNVKDTNFMHELLDLGEDSEGNSSVECAGEKIVRLTTCWLKFGAPDVSAQIPLDVYIATPETWATLLLIRTGSAEHNIWIAQRAKACGGKLHADGSGLEVPGQYDAIAQRTVNARVVQAQSEEEIFKALGLPTPTPQDRECVNGKPIWLHGAAK